MVQIIQSKLKADLQKPLSTKARTRDFAEVGEVNYTNIQYDPTKVALTKSSDKK